MAPASLVDLLDRTARRHPDGSALAGTRGGLRWSLSWSGLRTRALLGAAQLRAAGVEPGDGVAVWAADGPRRLVAALAVHARGAAELPMDPRLPDGQASVVLEEADPDAAVVEADARRRRRALADAGVDPVVDPADIPDPSRPSAASPDEEGPGPDPDAPALLCPTGWAGDTEIVAVTGREAARCVQAAAEALPLDRRDRVLQAAPATHVPARVAGTLAPVAVGATVVACGPVDAPPGREAGADLATAAEEHGATVLSVGSDGAADLWRASADRRPPVDRVLSAGDPVPEPVRDGLEAAGVDIVEVHGPAETGPVVACGPREGRGLTPVPGMEVRPGDGGARIRGPGAPDAASEDGWYATGWLTDVDEDGRVAPRGRVVDLLEDGDEPLPAEVVEGALRTASPAVARAVAFPVEGETGAVLVPDGTEVEGTEEGKLRERLTEAARRADPGPKRVLVRSTAPEAEAGLRDHALEVRRRGCAGSWADGADWGDV